MPLMHDFPANPLAKPGYILEWNDEFGDPELDARKWLPYYLPHWSSREQSRANYAFRDGTLVLQITQDRQPWCPEFDREVKASCIQTGLFAGQLVASRGNFTSILISSSEKHKITTDRVVGTEVPYFSPLWLARFARR